MTEAPFFHDLVPDRPEQGRTAWLRTADGIRLRAVAWPVDGARGTVFILHGRSEYIEKYAPLAAEFARAGLASVTIDWRGQGLSDRHTRQPMMGHVAGFADYQTDLQALAAHATDLKLPKPWHVFSHSMGGAIALRALLSGFPAKTAVFSAPMWGISFAPGLRPVAWTLTYAAKPLRADQRFALSTGPTTYVATAPFAGNSLTRDETMFELMRRQVTTRPELALGGPSMGWLREALRECRALARSAPPDLPALTGLGLAERVVDPRPVHAVMARWQKGRLMLVPDAEHELVMERDSARRAFLDAALDRIAG
jgi:lysophospholipase